METFNAPPPLPGDGSYEKVNKNEELKSLEEELRKLKAIPEDQFTDLNGQDVQFLSEKIERIKWSLKKQGSSN